MTGERDAGGGNANGKNMRNYTGLSAKQLSRWARKMRIRPNTILAFSSGAITDEGLEQLADAIKKTGTPNVVLLVVKDINNMRELDDDDMAALGWFKVETLRNIVMREKNKDYADGAAKDAGDERY